MPFKSFKTFNDQSPLISPATRGRDVGLNGFLTDASLNDLNFLTMLLQSLLQPIKHVGNVVSPVVVATVDSTAGVILIVDL